jgi:DNA repair protein RecO (recombination protein O)
MLTKDAAICIRAVDYSETSQIVSFFTRASGKIGAIAKGSKRPKSAFDGPIEIFSRGEIVFSHRPEKKLVTLTEFEQQPMFTTQHGIDLFSLNCSYFAGELLDRLTDECDPHPELFDSFEQFLQNVFEAGDRCTAMVLLILFQLSLLKEVGVQPILDACVNCKSRYAASWPEVYFSSDGNGLVCRDCEANFADKIRLIRQAANTLANLKTVADANEKTLTEIERILIHHFTEILHKPPRMAKYIVKC